MHSHSVLCPALPSHGQEIWTLLQQVPPVPSESSGGVRQHQEPHLHSALAGSHRAVQMLPGI